MPSPRLAEIIALLDRWYPPAYADSWDTVGLICGDPEAEVARILVAVDPVRAVADEAVAMAADLVITHHPLYLKPTSSVAADKPKGRVVHDLITHGCALFNAHTNADAPAGGVSEAMALALGLRDIVALDADLSTPLSKLTTYVPTESADRVRAALAAAGAGAIGDYDSCSFSTPGEGRFRPLEGAQPAIGRVGAGERVEEVRIEVILPRAMTADVVAAMKASHPYEEPAYDVVELVAEPDPSRGSGRIGRIDPCTLAEFATRVAAALPQTAQGVRIAGDPDTQVSTVALCGGAGDFLLDRARSSGADVYVTSDLRHHPASEAREHGGLALIDVAHWAAEWTWLPVLAERLRATLGDTVSVHVSTIPTDPWTFRVNQGATA